MPGLGRLLREELAQQVGAGAVGEVERDGRSDVVPFSAGPVEPVESRLSEDLFVELGSGDVGTPPRRLAAPLWSPERYPAVLPPPAPRPPPLGPAPRSP